MISAAGPLDWSLISGVLPLVILAVGLAALLVLLFCRSLHWWMWQVWVAAGVAVLITVGIALYVDRVAKPFPDNLPNTVLYWIALAVFAVLIGIARFAGWGWWSRLGSVGLVVLVLAMVGNGVNNYYGQYPTTRAALGLQKTGSLDTAKNKAVTPPPGKTLLSVWNPPANMPSTGELSKVTIPATKSGFAARPAYVYVPASYLATPRPLLPVLVLLHGQPGDPSDWVNGGQVEQLIDSYAQAHKGLAPVVVMPDATAGGNPICVNSRYGQAETYLAVDVPNWISNTLQVDTNHAHWAVGGFSYGGTCSIQLALNASKVYSTFLDISGQYEPTIGSHSETVQEMFGGSEEAFDAVNPVNLMQTKKFPGTAGIFTVGADDTTYRPQQEQIYAVAKSAGMNVQFQLEPDGHTWAAWKPALANNLGWLGSRMNITS